MRSISAYELSRPEAGGCKTVSVESALGKPDDVAPCDGPETSGSNRRIGIWFRAASSRMLKMSASEPRFAACPSSQGAPRLGAFADCPNGRRASKFVSHPGCDDR